MPSLINEFREVNPDLIELALHMGLELPQKLSIDGMNGILQSKWLQKGKHRYEIKGPPPNKKEIELLTRLDCIDPISADIGHYDGAILLGAIVPRVRARLGFLEEESRRGIVFRKVYALGSHRPLDPIADRLPKGVLLSNEMEMMEYILSGSKIASNWTVRSVKTPDVPLQGAGFRPANTGDTVEHWKKQEDIRSGRFLVCSNQPFVRYQEVNSKRKAGPAIELVGIGPKADLSLPLLVYLDNLAKQFYEEMKLCTAFPPE